MDLLCITRSVLMYLNLAHKNQLIRTLVMIVTSNVDYDQRNISIYFRYVFPSLL